MTAEQLERMRSLFVARQRGALWENFARSWQGTPAQGGSQIRKALGLDERPLVLLATNVLGDSLTLGRQVFSQSMAEWISRTVQYFAGRPDVQLVIRIHPGEVLTHGQSMAEVVRQVLPRLPEHIHLISRQRQGQYLRPGGSGGRGAGLHHHGGHGNGDVRRAGDRQRVRPTTAGGVSPTTRIRGSTISNYWG